MTTAVAIGECMVELSVDGAGEWRIGAGGDTLNTAVYLSRLGLNVAYLTALGPDPFSLTMRRAWGVEGVDTSLVLTDPDRLPGIYAIQNDQHGERVFHYWRENSAARRLFDLPGIGETLERASRATLLYLSGITLSLYDRPGRDRLLALAGDIRANGGQVAFDPNYRARGWGDPDRARAAFDAIAPHVSIALPTHDDERQIHDDADALATADRWRRAGVPEVVVKLGSDGCLVLGPDQEAAEHIPPTGRLVATDTTGAGDSFNAGYLAARQRGRSCRDAAAFANRLAGVVVGHRGAIMPKAAMPALPA